MLLVSTHAVGYQRTLAVLHKHSAERICHHMLKPLQICLDSASQHSRIPRIGISGELLAMWLVLASNQCYWDLGAACKQSLQ